MSKRKAFAAIRDVCGLEICPKVAAAESMGADMSCVAATAHQMRHALAAMLIMASTPNPKTCPNCENKLPQHNERCSIHRMMQLLR